MNSISIKLLLVAIIALTFPNLLIAGPIGHAPWVGDSFENSPCKGQLENFGPFDYLSRNTLKQQLHVVEKYHFRTSVEQLIRGQTSVSPLPDLDYVLRAWPNHHRALYSVIRHRINTFKNVKIISRHTPAECYLQRAIKFSPNDSTALMLYGILLHRTNHKEEALKQYRLAQKIDPYNIQMKYNLGLLLVDMNQHQEANEYAQELYSRGYPLPGLKDKLVKAGQWESPHKDE